MKKASIPAKKQTFSSDERNNGGRTQITQLLYNHYNALLNAKPTIRIPQDTMAQWNTNSQTSTYKSCRSSKGGQNIRQKSGKIKRPQSKASKNSMAGTSARHIGDGYQTNIRPASAQFGKYRGRNYKDDDHINREHMLNLKSQYKKISDMGYTSNNLERKKKPYDPVANPALLFKRKKPRGVSSEVAGPTKIYLNDRQENPTKTVKSVSKPKKVVPAVRKQRIYRTEYGDFTEDQLREI